MKHNILKVTSKLTTIEGFKVGFVEKEVLKYIESPDFEVVPGE